VFDPVLEVEKRYVFEFLDIFLKDVCCEIVDVFEDF
jgi:hypothetical protein